MSVFRTQKLACPSCSKAVAFSTVLSVNADRRPDFRDAILDGSFQREFCPECGQAFRLEPEMTYFDLGLRLWLLVRPVGAREQWPALQKQAGELFAAAFGPKAPPALREETAAIHPRLTFGWAGLREKIVCAQAGVTDSVLELVKLSTIRSLDNVPFRDETELRLVSVEGGELVLAWIRPVPEDVVETLRIPRELYAEIESDADGWGALRAELASSYYVDYYRLLIPGEDTTESPAVEAGDEGADESDAAPAKKKSRSASKKGPARKGASASKAAPAKKKSKK